MSYTPTKTHYGIGIVIIIAIVLWAGSKYWGWFGSSTKPVEHKDGEACTTSGGTAGVYKGGICTDSGGAPGGGPNSTERTTSSNPNVRVTKGPGNVGYLVNCPGLPADTYCATLSCVDKVSAYCKQI